MIHFVKVGDFVENTIDKLKIYRGHPYKINEQISIRIPTLNEICDYGEQRYYSMIHMLCSVGIDLCWQLEEIGIKFDEISDYELFRTILCKGYNQSQTEIIFGDSLDFTKMKTYIAEDNSLIMVQKKLVSVPLIEYPDFNSKTICDIKCDSNIEILKKDGCFVKINFDGQIGYVMEIYVLSENDSFYIGESDDSLIYGNGNYENIIIDESIYTKMISCLRDIHGLKRDNRIAGTRSCRIAFIEDAKMEYEANKNEPYKSSLLSLISTMVNIEGFKRNDETVWDMNIYAFMDSVKRIGKIRNASALLQSGYSGFGIDLKKIKKDEIDYMGELN